MENDPDPGSRSFVLINSRVFSDGSTERLRDVSIIDGRIDSICNSGSRHQRPRGIDGTIDLNGSYLMPSFIDAHMHFMQWSIMRNALDLGLSTTMKDIKLRIEALIQGKHHNEFFKSSQRILCCNFDESRIKNNPGIGLTRQFLDSISEDVPITVVRVCGHKVIKNTPALEEMPNDIDIRDDGVLLEKDAMKVSWGPPLENDPLKKLLDSGMKKLHSMGVTGGVEILPASKYDAFRKAFVTMDPGLDLNYSLDLDMKDPRIKGSPLSSWDDASKELVHEPVFLKSFMDGSIGARTASFNRNYMDHDAVDPLLTQEQLQEKVELSEVHGLAPMVHAIGDRAVEETLKVMDDLEGIYRIEHFESFSKSAALQVACKNGAVCLQPNFMEIWGRSGGLYSKALGISYKTLNRFGDLIRNGISCSFGTDMMPPGPLTSLMGCLDHIDPIQNISLQRSIDAFTKYSRVHSLLQGSIGRGDIRSGERADLVIVDRGFKKVQATIRKGKMVFLDPCLNS